MKNNLPGAGRAADGGSLWRIGTSGYSYPEWVTSGFYPEGTKSAEMLALYAETFTAAELNYTWYQMPKAEAIERQVARAQPGFLFAAKLTRTLTHEIEPDKWKQEATQYRRGIAPLIRARALLAVLIQLPPSFRRTEPNRSYLAELLDELSGLPLAIEFRHVSWASDRVFAELEKRKVSLVAVDAPKLDWLFPAVDAVTNPELLYARFHGRNARGWGSGSMQQQFDYDYGEQELERWIDEHFSRMADRARSGALFFNNHVRGSAPRNALTLSRLMRAGGYDAI